MSITAINSLSSGFTKTEKAAYAAKRRQALSNAAKNDKTHQATQKYYEDIFKATKDKDGNFENSIKEITSRKDLDVDAAKAEAKKAFPEVFTKTKKSVKEVAKKAVDGAKKLPKGAKIAMLGTAAVAAVAGLVWGAKELIDNIQSKKA